MQKSFFVKTCCFIFIMGVNASPAFAHKPGQPAHQSFEMGDLKLESGDTIKNFAISYVTHGELNAEKSNAILMVAAIAGNHHRIDFLIGPGKALDPTKYFIVATDAIGNGLTTSPSNSVAQPGTQFPHFTIRDMVQSQHRLLVEHFGINHMVAVAGASMGGMQVLQWGVSHPDFMDALIALTPMARTPAWSVAVNEATRQALMADPTWNGGDYTEQPEQGWRAWTNVLLILLARDPAGVKAEFPNALDVIPWIESWEERWLKAGFDANDWIYQTWAYDRHNVGTTSGFGGDHLRALKSIKAKTLIMTGPLDLYNPVEEAIEAARYIPDARYVQMPTDQGHFAASSAKAKNVELMNRKANELLNHLTE